MTTNSADHLALPSWCYHQGGDPDDVERVRADLERVGAEWLFARVGTAAHLLADRGPGTLRLGLTGPGVASQDAALVAALLLRADWQASPGWAEALRLAAERVPSYGTGLRRK